MRGPDRLLAAAWLALAAAALALSMGWLELGTLEDLRLCLFRRLTGWRCPGCGMGHALLAAFQGRWSESAGHHPLGLPLLAGWTLWLFYRARLAGLLPAAPRRAGALGRDEDAEGAATGAASASLPE